MQAEHVALTTHARVSPQDNAYPADELMPLSCRGRHRGTQPSRGDVDDILGKCVFCVCVCVCVCVYAFYVCVWCAFCVCVYLTSVCMCVPVCWGACISYGFAGHDSTFDFIEIENNSNIVCCSFSLTLIDTLDSLAVSTPVKTRSLTAVVVSFEFLQCSDLEFVSGGPGKDNLPKHFICISQSRLRRSVEDMVSTTELLWTQHRRTQCEPDPRQQCACLPAGSG